MNSKFDVSIIIPAYNSVKTISETLESVISQTFSNWEVIVVNDGSEDETESIAKNFAAKESRIRVVSQPHLGVSNARNTGIDLAQFDWLLFLDADDWILPVHLERLTGMLASNPRLDVAHCACIRVTSERTPYDSEFSADSEDTEFWNESTDMFDRLAEGNEFAIHSCIIRRSLVEELGKFDPTLDTYEDWDLWQRVARSGACFGGLKEVLALYRVRPKSASMNAFRMLEGAIRVLNQGHKPDPRVLSPHPKYAQGKSVEKLPILELRYICRSIGLAIGVGNNFESLVTYLREKYDLEDLSEATLLDPIKDFLYYLALSTCFPLDESHELWDSLKHPINQFLNILEQRLMVPELTRRLRLIMERVILQEAVKLRPVTVGSIYAIEVELTKTIPNFFPPESTERLYCEIKLEGEQIGIVELPIFDGIVHSCVLSDVIAAEFAWSILKIFFKGTIYQNFLVKQESTGLSIWRGSLCLTDEIDELSENQELWDLVHEQIGWTVFLQEVWGRPEWDKNTFYQDSGVQKETSKRQIIDNILVVEISEDLFDIETDNNWLNVVVTVGGTVIGAFTIPVESKYITGQKLRSVIIEKANFELCIAVVRETLVGKTYNPRLSLRERLFEAFRRRQSQDVFKNLKVNIPQLQQHTSKALSEILPNRFSTVAIGYRTQQAIGTSASRWAVLPSAIMPELKELACSSSENLISIAPYQSELETYPDKQVILYTPDLILHSTESYWQHPLNKGFLDKPKVKLSTLYDRGFFEILFGQQANPWDYTNSYEQTKYQQTLSLLPPGQIKQALELACAEGHFTIQLAPRVAHLVAADISQIALEHAAKRCADIKNVSFIHLDILKDSLPGSYELIVCSEVLYYMGDSLNLQTVAHKFVDALEPEGYLLIAHANLVVDEPNKTGFNWPHPFGAKVIGETFASTPGLFLVKELCTSLYRIQLFQRQASNIILKEQLIPEVIEAQHGTLTSEIAEMVLWEGGKPLVNPEVSVLTHTFELPILMYHQIAATGSLKMDRWRVTPEAFEEQLRYLKDAGCYSITLEEWQIAKIERKPLPGRAVLITFDDGYLDFYTYAWPLLKRYGFSALVFLAADRVGKFNDWDNNPEENLPLLGWQEIKQLQAEGIEFGSHSSTHRRLSCLSPVEIVREAANSKGVLERELGVPITAFAYPYGDFDSVVKHLIGASGYVFGLSCDSGRSNFQDSFLSMPRIEITGSDSLQEFVLKLNP